MPAIKGIVEVELLAVVGSDGNELLSLFSVPLLSLLLEEAIVSVLELLPAVDVSLLLPVELLLVGVLPLPAFPFDPVPFSPFALPLLPLPLFVFVLPSPLLDPEPLLLVLPALSTVGVGCGLPLPEPPLPDPEPEPPFEPELIVAVGLLGGGGVFAGEVVVSDGTGVLVLVLVGDPPLPLPPLPASFVAVGDGTGVEVADVGQLGVVGFQDAPLLVAVMGTLLTLPCTVTTESETQPCPPFGKVICHQRSDSARPMIGRTSK